MPDFAPDRYDHMTYRRCGRSGMKLPLVSLGLWQTLGEVENRDLMREVCFRALDRGITHFDLANNYGPPPGSSEEGFRDVVAQMPRDELIISTKAGFLMWPGPYGDWGSKKQLVASLDQSLQRMGLDYVDIFYHHRQDPQTPLDETLGALDQIVRQGKALYAGLSNYPGDRYCDAMETIQRHDWTPITIYQGYYNLLDRRLERDLLPHTGRSGAGVIAFCPLAQGLLTGKYLNGLPADSRMGRRTDRGQEWWDKEEAKGTFAKLRRLNAIAERRGQTLAQFALTWTARDERVASVLIGASSAAQIDENCAIAQAAPLSAEEVAEVEQVLAG